MTATAQAIIALCLTLVLTLCSSCSAPYGSTIYRDEFGRCWRLVRGPILVAVDPLTGMTEESQGPVAMFVPTECDEADDKEPAAEDVQEL